MIKNVARSVLLRSLHLYPRNVLHSYIENSPDSSVILTQRELEPLYLSRFIREFDIDCIFDVGANSGQYARMLRNKACFDGLIISFEPIPELAKKLRGEAANDKKWEVYELALSDHAGRADFNVMKSNQFSSFLEASHAETEIFKDANDVDNKISVQVERLDNIFSEIMEKFAFTRPLLKLDTQGNDLKVIDGAISIINRFYGVQSELAFKKIYENAPSEYELRQALKHHGFDLCNLFPNNDGHFPFLVEMDGLFVNRSIAGA